MLGELEAVAADWFRGLAGRGRKHPAPIGEPCANCGAILQGPYCHGCGQNGDRRHRSIWHLIWEAFEGLFHLDGRLLRTMPALFFRPGRLAKDYLAGRMARHVPPFRTFLVALLLLIFAAENAVHVLRQEEDQHNAAQAQALATPEGRAKAVARMRAEAVKLRNALLAEAARDHADELKGVEDVRERSRAEQSYQSRLAASQKAYDQVMARADAVARGETPKTVEAQIKAGMAASDAGKTSKSRGDKWFKDGLRKAVASPDYYLSIVFGWAHRMAVLLLPIVGLSLAGVYFYRRDLFLYDHLLVSMNLLSFAFLTNALGLVLPKALWPWWFGLLAIWTPINLFQTLRGAYGSSIMGALFKTLVVWLITVVTFTTLMVFLLLFSLSQI